MLITNTGGVLCGHQTSHRNWVIIKVAFRHSESVGWSAWIKSGICPSKWRRGTLWAHSVRSHPWSLASMWLGHKGCHTTGTRKSACRERDRTRYSDTDDRISDKWCTVRQREWDTTFMVQTIIFVECVGIIMGIQIPLMIIDRRGVSIMSACSRTVGWHT